MTLSGENKIEFSLLIDGKAKRVFTSKTEISVKRWTFVSVSMSSHYIKLYINSELDQTAAVTVFPDQTREPFIVGKLPFGNNGSNAPDSDSGFYGQVKDMRYFYHEVNKEDIVAYVADVTSAKDFDISAQRTLMKQEDTEMKDNSFSVAPPSLMSSDFDSRMQRAEESYSEWSSAMNFQLIELFSDLAEEDHVCRRHARAERSPSLLRVSVSAPFFVKSLTEERLKKYHLISHYSSSDLIFRLGLLQLINLRLEPVISLVDFSQATHEWSLAHRLSSMNSFIFMEVKIQAWATVLRQTNTGQGAYISVNRPKALKARMKGGDNALRKSVFGQIYRQLHFIRPSQLRTDRRAWQIQYEGEGGQDAGGLFRDSMTHICSELQSKHLPLFIPCPNSHTKFGDNQEKFVPNPSSKSSLHLSMFSFIGKLMGFAIRGGNMLNLDFPSIVWKPLVGQSILRADLHAIDSLALDVLNKVEKSESQNITAESFQEIITATFTTASSDGRQIELKENGADIPVSWENRKEFVKLVEEYRLKEFDAQIDAIRRGLATIVPVQLLPLFTWQELEKMVCGKREIDVDYLRANTRYRAPVRENDAHVKIMWETLKGFSHEDRQLFLRFVWGQSRLPYNPDDFVNKFEILPARYADGNPDAAMPKSHTCFFSIELPRYTTVQACSEKIMYAIKNCHSIDADHAVQNVDWEADD